jgi:hypothetical protein
MGGHYLIARANRRIISAGESTTMMVANMIHEASVDSSHRSDCRTRCQDRRSRSRLAGWPLGMRLRTLIGKGSAFYVRAGSQRQCVFRVKSSQAVRHVIDAGQIIDLDGAATSQLLRRYENNAFRPNASTDYASLRVSTSGVGDARTASVGAPIWIPPDSRALSTSPAL